MKTRNIKLFNRTVPLIVVLVLGSVVARARVMPALAVDPSVPLTVEVVQIVSIRVTDPVPPAGIDFGTMLPGTFNSESITVKNDGTIGVTVTATKSGTISSYVDIVGGVDVPIDVGASSATTVEITIPEFVQAGTYDGSILFTATGEFMHTRIAVLDLVGQVSVKAIRNETEFYTYDGPDQTVTIGSTHIRDFLGFGNQTDVPSIYLSLSNDGAPNVNWVDLPGEITGAGLARATGTPTVVNATAYQVTYTWTASAAASVQCMGLHWDAEGDSSNNLLAAASMNSVSLQNGDTLEITWTVNIPDGNDQTVTIGSTHIRDFLGFGNQSNVPSIYLSLSNDGAPNVNWVDLPGEITASGLARATGTPTVMNATAYQVTYTWTASAAASVQCTGLHWDAEGDLSNNLLAAASTSSVSLQPNDMLQVTWIMNIPDG